MADYPVAWTHDVVLSDGSTAQLRPIRPGDEDALRTFHDQLSRETVYRRFFHFHPHLTDTEVLRFVNVDYESRMAFVAEVNTRLVGVGRYEALADRSEAEVAFVIADDYQNRGVGSLLLEALSAYAPDHGFTCFVAETLVENQAMRTVFGRAGFAESAQYESGVVQIRMKLERTPTFLTASDRRDWAAAVASVRRLLEPRSMLLVGSDDPVSRFLLSNLQSGEFAGRRYVVGVPGGRKAAKVVESVGAIEAPIDVAFISIPGPDVAAAIEECGAAGVGHVVVISSGFADQDYQHLEAQRQLIDSAHRHGMRLLGPNSLGIVVPRLGLNPSLSPVSPRAGNVALASQSGGLGISLMAEVHRRGLGVSSFASMGNKADLSGNDFLRYWHTDPHTDVILLYIESFGNPHRFIRVASEVGRTKPILTMRTPGTRESARWTYSHNGALPLGTVALDALIKRSGVIAVDTTAELVDLAVLLARQPLPPGERVGVVGNAGGPLVVAANACETSGLLVPSLSEGLSKRLESTTAARSAGGLGRNPLNLTPAATPNELRTTIEMMAVGGEVDCILVVWIPVMGGHLGEVIASLESAKLPSDLTVALATPGHEGATPATATRLPIFAHAESAAKALSRAVEHSKWRRRDPGRLPEIPDLDIAGAQAAIHAVVATQSSPNTFEPSLADALVERLGLKVLRGPPSGVVEVFVGISRDRDLGPLVKLAAGGIVGRVIGESAVALAPVTDVEALELVHSLRIHPLLTQPSITELIDLLHRIGQLAAAVPELQTLVLDPVTTTVDGLAVTLAEITVGTAPAAATSLKRLRR